MESGAVKICSRVVVITSAARLPPTLPPLVTCTLPKGQTARNHSDAPTKRRVNPLGLQSRYGDQLRIFGVVCPLNGAAVLKGSTICSNPWLMVTAVGDTNVYNRNPRPESRPIIIPNQPLVGNVNRPFVSHTAYVQQLRASTIVLNNR